MGSRRIFLYPTLAEASAAAIALGFSTITEYRAKRHLDPQLHSAPDQFYKDEWQDWPSFFGKVTQSFYPTLAEASAAAIALGFATIIEYKAKRHLDPLLPSEPNQVYKDEWQDWPSFFGKVVKSFYPTLAEASAAATALGITSNNQYRQNRHLDPLLPSEPNRFYKDEWQDWPSFFGKVVKSFYPTLAEASAATIALGFTTNTEYKAKRHLDPQLPSDPNQVYKDEWQGWPSFFGKVVKSFYPTLAKASAAAIALGFTTITEYKAKLHLDPQLPSYPDLVYKDEWQGWPLFLGKDRKRLYPTLAEASAAAIALGIKSYNQYRQKRHLDPLLPSDPNQFYIEEWQNWPSFLGKEAKRLYLTLAQASAAAIALGITTFSQYREKRHLDPLLPSDPDKAYKKDWRSWPSFLGKDTKMFYPTLAEASKAAVALGITIKIEYHEKRHLDPRLHSDPAQFYNEEWQDWPSFLGKDTKMFYPTLAEASKAAVALGITTANEYQRMRHLDPKLPTKPKQFYKVEWQGLPSFLGKGTKNLYPTLAEASAAAIALGITTNTEYQKKRHVDPQLPSDPAQFYIEEWQDFSSFLLPKLYKSLSDVKQAVKVLNISDSCDYRNKHKLYPALPSHPERKFKYDWSDWYDLCDIPKPYTYDEAVALIASEKLASKRQYLDYIVRSGDLRLPRTPDQVYIDEWVNWYVFLGTREPYRIKNIRAPYTRWAGCIQEFLKRARGGSTKESHLCRFVRYYIQAYEMGHSPQEFLTLEKKDIRPFKEWLTNNETKFIAHKTLTSVNEFLDFIIYEYLTDVNRPGFRGGCLV